MSGQNHIYFMKQVGQDGPIKIGCTRFVGNRLIEMARWSPVPLEVVASAPGDFTLERHIHIRFKASLSHREWFFPTPELLSGIDRVKAGQSIVDAFDVQPKTRNRYGVPVTYYVAKAPA